MMTPQQCEAATRRAQIHLERADTTLKRCKEEITFDAAEAEAALIAKVCADILGVPCPNYRTKKKKE